MGNMAFLYGNGGEVNIVENVIANYQRKSGSVTLGANQTTVNCGFTPDVIFFSLKEKYTHTDYQSYELCTGVVFPELSNTKNFTCAVFTQNGTKVYEFQGKQITDGFTAAYRITTLTDNSISSAAKSFNYIAIKYT